MNSLIKIKDKKVELLFLFIIILGSIFISLPCFHTNMWFDESYTIAIAKHPFNEIWEIGSHDVHPLLYYFMIRIILRLTNESILCARLFSVIPLIIMAILGYTHIRKDFGTKAGIVFTFLSMFFPTCLMYAGEIRMYTWAMLFVTITAIYAYRIIKYRKVTNKNWIIFAIFSLVSAYTHYYGLAAAFVINIGLLLFLSIKSYKNKNVKESRHIKNLKKWFISAIVQIVAYIPWMGVVFNIGTEIQNYWIGFPNFAQMIEFQFTGNLSGNTPKVISWAFTILFLVYILYSFKRNWNRDEIKPAKLAILVYLAVLVLVAIISLIVEPILYARYLLCLTGIFIFVIAILLSIEKPKVIFSLCCIMLTVSLITNINNININYDKSNTDLINYMKENVQEKDIFIADDSLIGLALATELNVANENTYFWNLYGWDVEEEYRALGKTIQNGNELEDFEGRLWFVNRNADVVDKFTDELKNSTVVYTKNFKIAYEHENYVVTLIERKLEND